MNWFKLLLCLFGFHAFYPKKYITVREPHGDIKTTLFKCSHCNKEYQVKNNNGSLEVYRHGERWPEK